MASRSAADAAAAYSRGATFLDVRSERDRAANPLPRALVAVSADIAAGENLPEAGSGPIYLVCSEGAISELDCLYLREAGYEAYSVRGGARALLAELRAEGR